MKSQPKQMIAAYFNSRWKPSAMCMVLLIAFAVSALLRSPWTAMLSSVLFVSVGIALLGILCAGIWNLIKKRGAKGIANLALSLVCGAASILAIGLLMFASMFGPSEDGFADNLTIPTDIEVSAPVEELNSASSEAIDAFQMSLLTALSSPGQNDPTITAQVDTLLQLHNTAPQVLLRFLATSPSWRVFKERGNVFATRRWMIDATWRYELHGYYSRFDIGGAKTDTPNFQSRSTIGLSGKPWARAWPDWLKTRSNEWIGWSDNPQETFLSNTLFTIYEGDWNKPYAARFEVWFTPDSGASDRKLMDRVFKIEGWQR